MPELDLYNNGKPYVTLNSVGDPIPLVSASEVQTIAPNWANGNFDPERIAGVIRTYTDLSMRYVSNVFDNTLPTIRSLPKWSDDISERFGPEIYDRMYKDSEVSASLDMLVSASTSQDIRFIPSVDTGYGSSKAKAIAEFANWSTQNMSGQSFDDVRAACVLSALKYGNSVAEMVFSIVRSGKYKGYTVIDSVKDANITEYSFVIDNFNNLIGIIPTVNKIGIGGGFSQYLPLFGGSLDQVAVRDLMKKTLDKEREFAEYFTSIIVPRDKFICYTWHPQAGDPRGRSAIRSAYAAWWLKQQVSNEMLSWIEKFSQPSIIGEVSENAQDQCIYDDAGNVISRTTPVDQLATQLKTFRSSSYLAVPSGTKINLLNVSGGGQIFLDILAYCNQEISRAILKQHLATSEGIHQSRAASTVHQDILSLLIISIKNWQKRIIARDYLKPLIKINFGDEALAYMPLIDIGDGDGFPLNPFEVSQLQGVGWFSPSQFRYIDKLLGLPVREEDDSAIQPNTNNNIPNSNNNQPDQNEENQQ